MASEDDDTSDRRDDSGPPVASSEPRAPAWLGWVAPIYYVVVKVNSRYAKSLTEGEVQTERDRLLEEIQAHRADISSRAADVFTAEVARVERLEDKLRSYGGLCAALLPLALALTVACFVRNIWWGFGLALAGLLHLASAYICSLVGSATYRLHTPVVSDVVSDLSLPKARRDQVHSARLLAYATANAPRGLAINNLMVAVERTVAIAVALSMAATGLLATQLVTAAGDTQSCPPGFVLRPAPRHGPTCQPFMPPVGRHWHP